MGIECNECHRIFPHRHALLQHCRDKDDHFYCEECNRFFVSSSAIEQHWTYSPVHQGDSSDNYSSETEEYNTEDESSEDEEETYCPPCNRYFVDAGSLWQHRAASPRHNWCFVCSKDFTTPHALQQHNDSRVHNARDFKCPLCPKMFKVPSAIALHIESGGCNPKVTRHTVTKAIHSLPAAQSVSISHRITGGSGSGSSSQGQVTYVATDLAWNGSAYECYLCHRKFKTLQGLNAHLGSPAHDEDEFKCPKCQRKYKLISGLIQHIESEACGLARFEMVQDRTLEITAQFERLLKL